MRAICWAVGLVVGIVVQAAEMVAKGLLSEI